MVNKIPAKWKAYTPTKRCGVCRKTFPRGLASFYRCSTSDDGLQRRCKFCDKAGATKWHRENKVQQQRIKERSIEKTSDRWNTNRLKNYTHIEVSRSIHARITKLKDPGQTFSQVIEILLDYFDVDDN